MKVKQFLSDLILYVHSVASLLLALVIQLLQHLYHFSTSFRLPDKLVMLRQTLVIVFCQYMAAPLKWISEVYTSVIYPLLTLSAQQIPIYGKFYNACWMFLVSVFLFVVWCIKQCCFPLGLYKTPLIFHSHKRKVSVLRPSVKLGTVLALIHLWSWVVLGRQID